MFPSAARFVAQPLRERLRDRAGQWTVAQQVVLDQFVHHPFAVFPCAPEAEWGARRREEDLGRGAMGRGNGQRG